MFDEQLKALEDMSKELEKERIEIKKEECDLSTEERQKIVKRLLDSHVLSKSELRELTEHLGGFVENFFEPFYATKDNTECELYHCPVCDSCPESDYPGLEMTDCDPNADEIQQRPPLDEDTYTSYGQYNFFLVECHVCGWKERKWLIETY